MVKYPKVQKRAQEEIDRVVGRNRLPDYSDKESLPYILAMVKEAMRWNMVNPNGASLALSATILLNFASVAHQCTEDDEVDGYFIPKGTVVIGNSW